MAACIAHSVLESGSCRGRVERFNGLEGELRGVIVRWSMSRLVVGIGCSCQTKRIENVEEGGSCGNLKADSGDYADVSNRCVSNLDKQNGLGGERGM
jgi:hypothetical protein